MRGTRPLLLFAILLCGASPTLASPFDPWRQSATYDVNYEIDIQGLESETTTTLWVPLPAENQDQTLNSQRSDSPWGFKQITDSQGNAVAELTIPAGPRDASRVTFFYNITRQPASGLDKTALTANDQPKDFLKPLRKIPLDGVIQRIALEEKQKFAAGENLQRGYYDYVYDLMTYSKEGEGWGQGDAVWACQSKYGNCTDFHSLYIGLARSQDIPARFKIGFPLSATEASGRHDGYHCWAEAFSADQGWIPLDASEAKKAGLRDEYYGALPSDRIELTQGRDIILSSNQRGAPINYFVYPYAESTTTITERLPVKLTWTRISQGI